MTVREVAEAIELDLRLDAEAMKDSHKAGVSSGIEELAFRIGPDAEIYRGPCPTCGGSKECPACAGASPPDESVGMVNDFCTKCGDTGICPDCGKASVVMQELRKQAARAYLTAWEEVLKFDGDKTRDAADIPAVMAGVDAVLSTVLGDVCVATEILHSVYSERVDVVPEGGCGFVARHLGGDDIAILAGIQEAGEGAGTRCPKPATSCKSRRPVTRRGR